VPRVTTSERNRPSRYSRFTPGLQAQSALPLDRADSELPGPHPPQCAPPPPHAAAYLFCRPGFANRSLRQALVESARGAIRTRDSYLAAQYRRLVKRRGDKKAIVAVAHRILVIASPCCATASRTASWAATTSTTSMASASPATTRGGWSRSATRSP
jgi:hypothetical protein